MTSSACAEDSFLNDDDGISFLGDTVQMSTIGGNDILLEASMPTATSPKSARAASQSTVVGAPDGAALSTSRLPPPLGAPTNASAAAPPPPAARNARRFMNPLAERAAQEERSSRMLNRQRRVAMLRQPVPMQLPPSVREEIKAMGLILHARYARLFGSPHEAALAAAAAGSLARGNVRSQEILGEVALQWALAAARPAPPHDGEFVSKQQKQRKPNVTSSWEQPPLPVVVKPKIRLSNEDARVLFRSGATRSGQYGVYYWQFEEENHEGVLPATAESGGPGCCMVRRDPLLDYILVDDAEEHKRDDGGLMIPFDLKYLVEDDEEDVPNDGMVDGDNYAASPAHVDDIGEHRVHGKRNLLTLSLLRMWQHHEGRAARQVAAAGAAASTTTTTSQSVGVKSKTAAAVVVGQLKKQDGGCRTHATTASQSHVDRRSLEVLIDSPRSAYVLLKNGQKASELAVSTDPLLEERCQQRIKHLQEEYQTLCCRVSQHDMACLLTSAVRSQKQQSGSRPQTSPGVSPQRHADGRSSVNTTLSVESSIAAAESPQSRPASRLSRGSLRGSIPRGADRGTPRSANHSNDDAGNDTGMHREDVLDALQLRLQHVAEAKEASRLQSVERHQQHLASIWGRELQSFTAHHEKAQKVEEAVATRKRLTQLRAAGLLKEDHASLQRTMTPQHEHRSQRLGGPNNKRAATSMGPNNTDGAQRLPSPATDALVTPRHMQASSTSFQQSPTSEFSPLPISDTTSMTRHRKQLGASSILRVGGRTPLEIAREQYQQKEAQRIRLLEEALQAKGLAAKKCQERKQNALDARRREQLARMREVHAKSDRVKRAFEFHNALMLFHQDQQDAKLDAFHARKEELNRALQDVQHLAGVEEEVRRQTFQETQRALIKTMFYEAQRRIASEEMRASFTTTSGGGAVGEPLPSIGDDRRPTSSSADTSSKHHHHQLQGVVVANVSGGVVVDGSTTTIASRRKQWDPIVMRNSKTKLVALLNRSAQQ